MSASVKNKIRWGTIFLFLLVATSGGVGIYYLVKLRLQSKNILTANYESLQYAHSMQIGLDSMINGNAAYRDSINAHLSKQESNVTENGEGDATRMLRIAFDRFTKGDTSQDAIIREQLQIILMLNMEAIKNKSVSSEAAAEEAVTIIITSVAIILVIGFTFVVNFPSVITDPINRFTEAIKEISQKNYRHRVHIESKDEFGRLAASFNDMAERMEYFENSNLNKLIFEKTRAEAVINSLKDASIGIDKSAVVLFANQQALQLLGLSAKDIIGKNVDDVASRNDLFKFLFEEKSPTPFKVVVDNRENYFIREVIEITQESGGSKVLVLKNVTSFKELDVAKTNFIATVSHELKTPLASSDFSIRLLEDERVGTLSEEHKDSVRSLKADNQRMLRILSELLNMSQLEAGRIELNIQSIDVRKIVDSSVNAVRVHAKAKGIDIEKNMGQDVPAIQGDADKIVWVLNNFLTNAIKFSPEKSLVLIEVKTDGDKVLFAVTDHGPGIEDLYLTQVFDRYFQVPGGSKANGSGIGLAICKEFIEAMGGTVWVKSKVGTGSTFGFCIPLETSAVVG